MNNAEIDQDISRFVADRLVTDPKLQKWRRYATRSSKHYPNGLTAGKQNSPFVTWIITSNHRFRWAECQFEALQRCPKRESPRPVSPVPAADLGRHIPADAVQHRRGVCGRRSTDPHSPLLSRRLTLPELIDGVTVDLTEQRLDPRRRLQDAGGIAKYVLASSRSVKGGKLHLVIS